MLAFKEMALARCQSATHVIIAIILVIAIFGFTTIFGIPVALLFNVWSELLQTNGITIVFVLFILGLVGCIFMLMIGAVLYILYTIFRHCFEICRPACSFCNGSNSYERIGDNL